MGRRKGLGLLESLLWYAFLSSSGLDGPPLEVAVLTGDHDIFRSGH